MKRYKLVLASTSPRRRELLAMAGVEFIVSPPGVGEDFLPDIGPRENAERIAMDKAMAASGLYPDDPVLGADTVVVLGGQVIGKPVDAQDAERMLSALSGNEHQVVTGFAIAHGAKGLYYKSSVVTLVRFKKIPAFWIREYVAGGEPLDKAGAYAIQGGAGEWVESYSGSYTNIIGLPMEAVREAFWRLGLDVFPAEG